MKTFLLTISVLAILLIGWRVYAAATSTIGSSNQTPFGIIDVTAAATYKLAVPDNDITIVHLGIQDDNATASAAGDFVIIMNGNDTMTNTLTASSKIYLPPGASVTFRGYDCAVNTGDGVQEIQLKASGHGAAIQWVKGSVRGTGQ